MGNKQAVHRFTVTALKRGLYDEADITFRKTQIEFVKTALLKPLAPLHWKPRPAASWAISFVGKKAARGGVETDYVTC